MALQHAPNAHRPDWRSALARAQAMGQNRAMQMRALSSAGKLLAQLDRWTAVEGMCRSARGDELDARCTAARCRRRRAVLEVVRCEWLICLMRHRHTTGASVLLLGCVRLKPAVPWGAEGARRVFSAMIAAVRHTPRHAHYLADRKAH